MCYFRGQRAKILTVSKRKPLEGWKVVEMWGGEWHSPYYTAAQGYKGTVGKIGAWCHASPHGYYVMRTRAQAHAAVPLFHGRRGRRARRVLFAGKVRQYNGIGSGHAGYRAEWMKVL